MTSISLRGPAMRAVASVFAATLLCSCALSPAADPSKSAKARIEGVYALQEWHLGGEVVRAPRVDGRFFLLDGVVITVLHNRVQEGNQTTVASYGSYVLDAKLTSETTSDNGARQVLPSPVTCNTAVVQPNKARSCRLLSLQVH